MADPFSEYEDFRRRYESITATGPVLTPEQQAKLQAEKLAKKQASDRFDKAGPGRRVSAGLRNLVGSVPIVRNIPSVKEYANPPRGTEAGEDLADFRLGRPGTASFGGLIGGSAPYMAVGGLMPGLFSRMGGAMIGNAAIGAIDAATGDEGRNPGFAALEDALATIPGAGLAKLISPLSNATAGRLSRHRNFIRDFKAKKLVDEVTDTNVSLLDRVRGRNRRGQFTRRIDPQEAARRIAENERRVQQTMDRIFHPRARIGTIPERTGRRIDDSILWGTVGALGGSHPSINNPVVGGMVGASIPIVRRMGQEQLNRAIRAANKKLMSPIGGRINTAIQKYRSNQILPDRARAIAHALSVPATKEAVDAMREDEKIPMLPRLRE